VDWRGNEANPPLDKPAAWPTDAFYGQPGLGTRPGTQLPGAGLTVLTATPGSGTVTITWTTSVMTDSSVDLGTTTALGQHYYDPTQTTSHSVTISGLLHSQLYNYRVSGSGGGYTAISALSTFTTLA
jgi:hypothetical protein